MNHVGLSKESEEHYYKNYPQCREKSLTDDNKTEPSSLQIGSKNIPAALTPQAHHPQARQPRPPSLSKYEKQVHIVTYVLQNPQICGICLCQNLLGTRYFIFYLEIVLITDPELYKKLKALINQHYSQIVSDRAIKAALDITEGLQHLWIKQSHSDLPIRISIITGNAFFLVKYNTLFDLGTHHEIARGADQYIGFKSQRDIKPFPQELINQLQDSSLYKHFKDYLPQRLEELYSFFLYCNIESKSLPVMLTWAIHSLISSDYILLEITGEPESGKSTLLEMLKKLIDFTHSTLLSPPKNQKDLTPILLNHHLLSFDNVDELSNELQNDFVNLLSIEGLQINLSKRDSQLFTVCRPIIITSIDSVITNQQLIDKSISIELKEIHHKQHPLNHLVDQEWALILKDLLFLGKYILELAEASPYNQQFPNYASDRTQLVYHQPKMKSFVDVGLLIESCLTVKNHSFLDSLNNLAKDQADSQLNNNEVAFLIYKMAESNPKDSLTYSVSEWIEALSLYAEKEKISLTNMTAHKLGREFKKAKPILKNYGIILESQGKQSRLVKWKITTPESIENNTYKPIATFGNPS